MFKVNDYRTNPETDERDMETVIECATQAEAERHAQSLADDLSVVPDEFVHDVKVVDAEVDKIVFETRVYADIEPETL